MKLYLLKLRDDTNVKTAISGYEVYNGFVIRAENESEARGIARITETNPHASPDWENPDVTSCMVLTAKGERGVVFTSYRDG